MSCLICANELIENYLDGNRRVLYFISSTFEGSSITVNDYSRRYFTCKYATAVYTMNCNFIIIGNKTEKV